MGLCFSWPRESHLLNSMSRSSGQSMFLREKPDRFCLGSEKTDLYCALRMLAIPLGPLSKLS